MMGRPLRSGNADISWIAVNVLEQDMRTLIKHFLSREDGAVTVDWVVLTAAIVGMGFAVLSSIAGGALDHSTGLGAHLDSRPLTTTYQ
jgi:hypothetical protein